MASFNIELNNKPIKGSNEHNLLLRITINRKHTRVSLMYNVLPNQFNPNGKKSNYIRSNHPDHKWLNEKLDEKITQAKEIVADREKKGKPINGSVVKDLLMRTRSSDFMKFMEDHINELKESSQFSTAEKYHASLISLKEYTGKSELAFDEITVEFINAYEKHLVGKDKARWTIHGLIKNIKALFNKAIQKGIIDPGLSPFITIRLKQGKPSKERLSMEEIEKIEELKLKERSLIDNVRNAFLFSFYNAGIRISDILQMTWDNIKVDRLVYTMYKTNKVHSLKLKEKPLAILEKYKNSCESFIFPFFSGRYDYSDPLFLHNQIGAKTALINKYLKEIAMKAEIKKKVTTHTARHSFADIARQKTDNLYNLSKTLGHSSLKVTEAYLATFDEKAVDDTLDSVFS
jgi:integrase/recombinase XerD